MAKNKVLFATLLGACATGQAMGMEEKSKGSLSFYVTNSRRIKTYSATGLEFLKEPSKFQGEDILKAIPLSKEDRNQLKAAFELARERNQKATSTYTLEQKKFLATITPLIKSKKSEKRNFFVEVQEIAQAANEMASGKFTQPVPGITPEEKKICEEMFEL